MYRIGYLQLDKKGILNLASEEYSKVLNFKKIGCKVVTPTFKTEKNGILKTVGILSKRARGMMANFIIKNQIEYPQHLKEFSKNGYSFDASLSCENKLIFIK